VLHGEYRNGLRSAKDFEIGGAAHQLEYTPDPIIDHGSTASFLVDIPASEGKRFFSESAAFLGPNEKTGI
jgi:hypothetical protein